MSCSKFFSATAWSARSPGESRADQTIGKNAWCKQHITCCRYLLLHRMHKQNTVALTDKQLHDMVIEQKHVYSKQHFKFDIVFGKETV
jgi:hypothetical protein